MLDLSRVTLVVVATRAHALTKIAIEDILTKGAFGDVIIFTNDRTKVDIGGALYYDVPDWETKREAGQFYYAQAALKIETEFGLFMEWDAGIYDPKAWKPEFLSYDYIGAPWVTRDAHKVGNGGFTIMSKRFSQWLCQPSSRASFPCSTDWELCRGQRRRIEREGLGFTWAPFELAHDWSWELIKPRSPFTFGYHGVFNWPDMIGKAETLKRARIMSEDPYLLPKLEPLFTAAPWVADAIGEPAWLRYCAAHPRSRFRPQGPLGKAFIGTDNCTASSQQRAQLLIQQRKIFLDNLRRTGLKA